MKSNTHLPSLCTLLIALFAWPCSLCFAQQAGDPDPSFGNNGTVLFDCSTGNDMATGMVLQPDQKPVIGGWVSGYPALARFNTDGSLDQTFGNNGLALGNVSYGAWPNATSLLNRLDDGKFLISFQSGINLARTRFNENGSIDTDFGIDGTVLQPVLSLSNVPNACIIQDDGKIVTAGSGYEIWDTYSEIIITRQLAGGTPDNFFSGDGIFSFVYGATGAYADDILQQPDGKLLVLCNGGFFGTSAMDVVVIRLNEDGTFDSSFGDNGISHLILSNDSDYGASMTLTPDGKIVIGGTIVVVGDVEALLLRLNADGTLDATFGENEGYTIPHLGDEDDRGESVLIASDGKIILAGAHNDFYGYGAVMRFTADGIADPTFGNNGSIFLDGTAYSLQHILQQADGKLIACGSESPDFEGFQLAASRLLYDGEVGISNVAEKENNLTLFPNPASSEISCIFSVPQTQQVKLEIMDELSRSVFTDEFSVQQGSSINHHLVLPELKSGTYFIRLTGKSIALRQTLIVTKN